jgi:NitT/TauT family transport system substrate-binding protein
MNISRRLRAFAIALTFCVTALAGHASLAADEAHTLKLRLEWLTSGYHAPIYLAQAKGWYKDAGLDLTTIEPGNGTNTTIQLVNAGNYDLGEAAISNVAIARTKGMPLKAIATWFRKGDLALMVPVDAGINGPKDLKGKKIIYSAASSEGPFLEPFLAKGGLVRSDVQLLNIDPNARISTFANGQADGIFGSPVGTGVIINDLRHTHNVLFADFGLNMPGFGLFATEDMLKKKGDALRKFASVSAGAWTYAKSHPDEAVAALMKERGEQDRVNPDQIKKQFLESLQFLYSPASANLPIGINTEKDWAEALATMVDAKAMDAGAVGKPTEYFTNDYLDAATIKKIGG